MDKKLHCNIVLEGPDADKFNVVDVFFELAKQQNLDAKATSASISIYYTPSKAST